MPSSPRHSVSVAAIISNDLDEVLLIRRRDNGHWEPPGGVLELDEDIQTGVRREVLEEIGAAVDVGDLTGVYKNMPGGIVALVFRCTVTSEPKLATHEASLVAWHPLAEVPQLMNQAYAIRIADAMGEATAPAVRAHDGRRLISDDLADTDGPENHARQAAREAALPAVGARIRIRDKRDPASEFLLGTVVEHMDDTPYRTAVNGIVVRTDRQGINIYPLASQWESV